MLYEFHGNVSALDLKDVVAFEPDLAAAAARMQGEPNVEEAIAVLLDLEGARFVQTQSAHLQTVGVQWAHLAKRAKDHDERERIRAIPDRLCLRFDPLWPEGRAAVHLMLRSISAREGCEVRDAALFIDHASVSELMTLLIDGLRKGFARSVDAPMAVAVLERAVRDDAKAA